MAYLMAEVVTRSEKEHALILGRHELGISKSRCDADFHCNAVNDALAAAYRAGTLVSDLPSAQSPTHQRTVEEIEHAGR